jgi:long-subunit fatty acid transport protein
MKRNLLFIIALFVCSYSFGQGEIDALRSSFNDLSGTARGQAMGGAFGAVGGDVTGVAINPAGIGIYRRSEIVANLSVTSNNTKTDSKIDPDTKLDLWSGKPSSQSRTKFSFDNLSYVGYHPLSKGSVVALNFGFNYNRLKNFDRKYSTSGSNMTSSLTDYLANYTNGTAHSWWDQSGDRYNNSNLSWLSILAWDGYLINEKNGTNNEYISLLGDGEKVNPRLNVSERGYIESYDFTIGSNISDRFYWGVTFSLTDLFYSLSSSYGEDFSEGGGFDLDNELETEGSGYQFKAGVIYRPIDALRLGVSYHSPTWYSMTDRFHAIVFPNGIYNDDDVLVGPTETPTENNANNWSYSFRTPSNLTFSAAAIIGSRAVVSVDYELKDYSSMKLDERYNYRQDYSYDNQYISEDFKNTSTLRAGLEYCFTPQFSGRLGYAWMQNPNETRFKAGEKEVGTAGTVPHFTLDGDATYLTAGAGYRFAPKEAAGGYFYIDVAFVYRQQESDLYFYSPVSNLASSLPIVNSYPASLTNNSYKGLVTFGYKF